MPLNEQAKGKLMAVEIKPEVEKEIVDATVWYKSKRIWVAVLTPILPNIPVLGPVLLAYPEILFSVLGIVFGGVGVASTKPISFKK